MHHQALIAYINQHLSAPISEEEESLVQELFRPITIRKHQFFLQAGEISRRAAFIVKGAMKQYTLDSHGKEQIIGLYLENWWAGDRESMTNNTISPYFIDAVETSELLVVKQADMDALGKLSFMGELMRALTERQAFQLMRRIHIANTMTAEEKLADLERNYPEFLLRFPQWIIASYLGMTKETLSRIRRK